MAAILFFLVGIVCNAILVWAAMQVRVTSLEQLSIAEFSGEFMNKVSSRYLACFGIEGQI